MHAPSVYHPFPVFSPIPEILDDVRAGRFVVLLDAEDRENEGDLVLAAEHATPERLNQMLRLAGGYLCLSLTPQDCDRLQLHPQSMHNTSVRGTPFTVSIDGHPRHGVGTGVSAADRAATVLLAIDPTTGPEDFVRPGHINPLRSREGGVLVRIGQTEGGVDLARLAGLHPSALIIEIVREDGQMARRDDLAHLCSRHGLKACTIDQLIEHRLQRERLVRRLEPASGSLIRTPFGAFTLFAYESVVDPLPHVALTMGGVGVPDASGRAPEQAEPLLVRMHRRHLLGDIFCDLGSSPDGATRDALVASMEAVRRAGRGVIVYLRPQGQGDALDQRLSRASGTSDVGVENTPRVPMHLREFGIGGQILRDLGVRRMRLLTNHPKSLPGLDAFGLEIVEQVGLG
ncbi:MAG TPA: 3,4-dihydroxy-2-butanone-4-phosphate synthase [Phycisphaerales bacterium]|nr:3,4-dihydroxy-2-butanone-4-phosphate synthase [Phycisphaerales bacterium]